MLRNIHITGATVVTVAFAIILLVVLWKVTG